MKKKILTAVGVLALVAALAVPMAAAMVASADTTTEVTGDVTTQVSFAAPPAIALGDMQIPWNKGTSAPDGFLSTNNPAGCTLTVYSNHAEGKMSTASYTLTNYLLVNTGNSTDHIGSIPATDPQPPIGEDPPVDPSGVQVIDDPAQEVMSSSGPIGTPISLVVYQKIDVADAVDDGYSIVLTYVATANL